MVQCARFYDIHVGHSIPGVAKKELAHASSVATFLRADPDSGGENERYPHGTLAAAPTANVDVKVTLPGAFKTNDRGKVTLEMQPC